MVRSISTTKMVLASAFAFLAVTAASGTVIFENDFTSDGTFGWTSNASMSVTATNDGTVRINNTNNSVGLLYYTPPSKPSTFTLTFTINSISPVGSDAGVLFCKQSGNSFNGYLLSYDSNGDVLVYKVIETGNSISLESQSNPILFYRRSPNLNFSSANTFIVSKNGNNFNVFANDDFIGSFSDGTYGTGDVAFFMMPQTDATFGAISMTDEVRAADPVSTSFSDDFNGSALKKHWRQWRNPGNAAAPVVEHRNNELFFSTGANVASYNYVDFDLDNFEVSVETRHPGGKGTGTFDFYGIVLLGAGRNPQSVCFGITGDQYFATWSSDNPSIGPTQNTAFIRGSVISGKDVLKVVKEPGASTYKFLVNGQDLATIAGKSSQPVATFPIVGVGVFVGVSLQTPQNTTGIDIYFDNFYAGPEGGTSISWRNPTVGRKSTVIRNASPVFYDLRGRRAYSKAAALPGDRRQTRAAGVYVNKSEREVLMGKRRK